MIFSRLVSAAILAASCAGGSSIALAQIAPPAAPQQMEQERSRGNHERFLTPEQRVMWRTEHRGQMKSLSQEQREAYRHQLREQFMAMTPEQKAQTRDQLQAEWNQLPQQRQQAIEQRLAQRQQNGHSQQGHQHSYYPAQGSGNSGAYQN
jgi:hypothetical protein